MIMFGGLTVVAEVRKQHLPDSIPKETRVREHIATSLRLGRDLAGTIADARRLQRLEPKDQEFYADVQREARRRLEEEHRKAYAEDAPGRAYA